MATRRNGRSGSGRNGSSRRGSRTQGGRTRQRPERKRQSSALIYAEIAGAALVAVLLIVVFGGGTRNDPPREEPEQEATRDWEPKEERARSPRPEKEEKDSWRPRKSVYRGPTTLYGDKGVPPGRPAPAVDLKPGEALYREAKKLYDEQEHLREKGRADEARRMLRRANDKLEKALATVKALDRWVEQAILDSWNVDSETRKKLKVIERWGKLYALIHKVLPKTD
jgi:hypothetical protein